MNKYTKPTISLLSLKASAMSASTCSTSGEDAKEILDILDSMGIPKEQAFGIGEGCAFEFIFEDYCKFTSSIQVFFS